MKDFKDNNTVDIICDTCKKVIQTLYDKDLEYFSFNGGLEHECSSCKHKREINYDNFILGK